MTKPQCFPILLFQDGYSGRNDEEWKVRRAALLRQGLAAICNELRQLGCPAPPPDWLERADKLQRLRDYALSRLRVASDRAEAFTRTGVDPEGVTGTDLLRMLAEWGGAAEALRGACDLLSGEAEG
jgi:hypothetical protein